jgi:hypothetical protein
VGGLNGADYVPFFERLLYQNLKRDQSYCIITTDLGNAKGGIFHFVLFDCGKGGLDLMTNIENMVDVELTPKVRGCRVEELFARDRVRMKSYFLLVRIHIN